MGTRSLTIVIDEEGREVLNMYRQFDGYPGWHGLLLATFLERFRVVNGVGSGDGDGNVVNFVGRRRVAVVNGAGCLAAAIVWRFKEHIGNVYLLPHGMRDCGEEYTYTVSCAMGKVFLRVDDGDGTLFEDPAEAFVEWYKRHRKYRSLSVRDARRESRARHAQFKMGRSSGSLT